MARTTKLFIIDDHAILREGLKAIVAATDDITVVAEAATAAQAIERINDSALVIDVVLLDIAMSDRSGFEIFNAVKKLRPQWPVLVLSMYGADRYATRALKAGAAGYLNKATAIDELVGAIRRVAGGQRYISSAAAEELVAEAARGSRLPHELLSDRELQIMRLLAEARTPTQIAASLALSVKTVSTHRTRILQKMGLSTTPQLMRYAIEHKLS